MENEARGLFNKWLGVKWGWMLGIWFVGALVLPAGSLLYSLVVLGTLGQLGYKGMRYVIPRVENWRKGLSVAKSPTAANHDAAEAPQQQMQAPAVDGPCLCAPEQTAPAAATKTVTMKVVRTRRNPTPSRRTVAAQPAPRQTVESPQLQA